MPATANSEIVIFNPVATLPESGLCFFLIYREMGPDKWTPVYKSEIKRPEGGAFKWNQCQLGSTNLCGDNIEKPIKIEFFRSVPSGKHKLIDLVDTLTLAQFKEGSAEHT